MNMERLMFIQKTTEARISMSPKQYRHWLFNTYPVVFVPNQYTRKINEKSFYPWDNADRPVRNKNNEIIFTKGVLEKEQDKGFPHFDEVMKALNKN